VSALEQEARRAVIEVALNPASIHVKPVAGGMTTRTSTGHGAGVGIVVAGGTGGMGGRGVAHGGPGA